MAGCGFTPLYATPAVSPAMALIQVEAPGTLRTSFLLKQQLNQQLGRDEDVTPQYRLALKVSELRFPLGVRVNNVANRYEIDATAIYTLSDAATGKVLYQGHSIAEVSYDSADPPYAGVQANQDGETRVAGQLADLIQLNLARYFYRQATPG